MAKVKTKKMEDLSPFTRKVIDMILSIPEGKVATYQQIAGLCGKPHASRGVSWILNSCTKKYKLPWQRVLSSQGRIAFKSHTRGFALQRLALRKDGVEVEANGGIDMKRFQWKKKPRARKARGLRDM